MLLCAFVGFVLLSINAESFRLDTLLQQNDTFKATSVSALSSALLIGQRIARGNTTSGVYVFDNSTQSFNLILGAGAGCSDQGSQHMNIQPVSITALSDRQFLVTESMWSSRVWLASGTLGHTVANSNLTVQKVVGSLCNFTETMVMVNNSNVSSGDVAIAPPDYTAYRVATQQLFFTQRASIVAITDRIASVYFGTNEKRVRTNTLIFGTNERWLPTNTEVTGFRTEIPTSQPAQIVVEESLGCMFFPEQTIGSIRKIDFDTGLTSIVAGSPLLAFWPPPDCNSSVPCRAVDANDTNPVVYLVYVRALAFHRNGSSPNLYFVDTTLALLFRLDLSTNTVVSVAGQLLQNGVVDGETGSSLLTPCYQLAVWDNVLVLASGSLRTMVIGSPTPKPFSGWNVTFPGNSTLSTQISLPAGSNINLPNGTTLTADNATYVVVSSDSSNATYVNTTSGGLAVPSGTFSITPANGSSIAVPGVTVVTLLNGSSITIANLSFILPIGGAFVVINATTFSLPNGTTLISFSAATGNLTQLDGGTITVQPGVTYSYSTPATTSTATQTTLAPPTTASPATSSAPVSTAISATPIVPSIDPQNFSIGITGGAVLTSPSGTQTPLSPSATLVLSSPSGNSTSVTLLIPSTGAGGSSSVPALSGTLITPSLGGQISIPTGTLVLLSNGQTVSTPPGGMSIEIPVGTSLQVVNGTLVVPPGSTADMPSLLIPSGVFPVGVSAPPQVPASTAIPGGTSILLSNGTTLTVSTTGSSSTSTLTLNPAGSSNPAALLTTSTGQLISLQPGSVLNTPSGSSFGLPIGSVAVLPDGTQLALPSTISLIPTSGIAVVNGTTLQLTSSTTSTSPGTFPLLPNGTLITVVQPGTAPAVGNLGNLSPTPAGATSSGSGTGLIVLNGGVSFNPTTISPSFGAATPVLLELSSVQTSATSGADFLVVRCTTANGDAVLSADGRNGTLASSVSVGATVTTQASTVSYSFAVFPPTTSTQLLCSVLGQTYTTTITLSNATQNQAIASATVQQSIGTTGGNAFVSLQTVAQSQGTLGLYSNNSNAGNVAVLMSSVIDPSSFNASDFVRNLSSILNTNPRNILVGFNASSNSLTVVFTGPNATGLLAAATQFGGARNLTGTSFAQTLSLATGLTVPATGTTLVTSVSQAVATSSSSPNDIRLALANLLNADPQSISVVVDPTSKQAIVSFSGSSAQALATKATGLNAASVAQLTGVPGSSFIAGEKAIPGEFKPLQNTTWVISSITPPVGSLPVTGGQVQLQGTNLDQLPSRLLVGPCVANISKVSSTEGSATLCPSVAWSDVAKGIILLPDGSAVQVRLTSQTLPGGTATTVTATIRTVSGNPDTASLAYLQWLAKEHPEDFVNLQAIAKLWLSGNESSGSIGNTSIPSTSSNGNSSLTSSLNSSSISRDGVICSACQKGSFATASLFEWTATHDVMISPVLGFQVLYGTSLTIPVIGVGSPAINLTIRTLVLNPINRLPIDVYASLLYPLQVVRQNTANGAVSSFVTYPDINLTETIASVSANLADASPIPIRLSQTWGSRGFSENLTLATTVPGFEVRIVSINTSDARRLRVMLRAVRAAVAAVVVQIVVQAPVKIPVSTSSTNCRTQFPGLECSFAELNLPAATASISRRQSQGDTFVPSAQVDLYLEVPDYYRGNVTVLVTAATTSINTVISGFLVVQPDPSIGNTTNNHGSASGSGPEVTRASGSQSTAGANPENAPADSPGAFAGNVAPMGIFPAASVLTCTEPLVLTILIFCILLLLSLIVSLACRNAQPSNISIPMMRSLLMKHAWLNLIPCGSDCAVIHILLPCCHVLGLIAVCSFLNFLMSSTASSVNFWVSVIIPILVVGPIVHTLLTFYFWRWHQDMDSFKAATRLHETLKLRSKLSSYGNRSFDAMVISPDMATLDNIELDIEGQVPDDSFDSTAVAVRQLPRDPNATIQELAKEERKEASLEETMPPPPQTPDTPSFAMEEPTIVVRPYRLKGYAIAVIFAILMAVLGFLTANKFGSVRSCSAFLTSLVYCLICDFFIAQFFSMLLAYFYRWLVSDEQDQLWSERHPVHDEKRRN